MSRIIHLCKGWRTLNLIQMCHSMNDSYFMKGCNKSAKLTILHPQSSLPYNFQYINRSLIFLLHLFFGKFSIKKFKLQMQATSPPKERLVVICHINVTRQPKVCNLATIWSSNLWRPVHSLIWLGLQKCGMWV